MAYNKNLIIEVKDSFAKKREAAKNESYIRTLEIYSKLPEISDIDKALSSAAIDITIEIAKGADNITERIEHLKNKNLELQQKRADILTEHGYPADYTFVKKDCSKCDDTGFVGANMCECLKQELSRRMLERSGIGKLAQTQSFDSFDLHYYASSKLSYDTMKANLEFIRNYVNNFSEDSRSLLFVGKTGLGKTHLSSAVAKALCENGYNVKYDTAQNILADFEKERFGKSLSTEENLNEMYFESDFLIIDDLGTELTNSFTVSALYNLINTRINNKKPMLINTNLTSEELLKRYESRITSRLFGEFDAVMFVGEDVRLAKLRNI